MPQANVQWRIITKEKKADIVVMDMPLLDTRRGKDLMEIFLSDICLTGAEFCSGRRMEKYKTKVGGRDCGSKSEKYEIWQTASTLTG